MIDITTVTDRTVMPPASKPIPTPTPTYRWAFVTGVSPLRIRLEGDTDPLLLTPSTLITPSALAVGDRVWTQTINGIVIVLGRGTGSSNPLGRLSPQIQGGGVRQLSSAGVSWDQRFLWITQGRGAMATEGFWDASMPPDGTVIPVYGSPARSSVTVASGGILLQNWESLWYEPPLGGNHTSDPSRFRIMSYQLTYTPPPTWLFIGTLSGDTPVRMIWADGRESQAWAAPTLLNSWANYGAGYAPAGIKRENGIVYVQGLVKSGTLGAAGVFALAAGYRPSGSIQWVNAASAGLADLRVLNNVLCVYALFSGTTASVSIQGSWPADG